MKSGSECECAQARPDNGHDHDGQQCTEGEGCVLTRVLFDLVDDIARI